MEWLREQVVGTQVDRLGPESVVGPGVRHYKFRAQGAGQLKEIQPSAIFQVGFGHNDLKVSGFQLARRVFQAADVYDVKGASSSIWASERASCGYGEFATVWSSASNLTGQLRDG